MNSIELFRDREPGIIGTRREYSVMILLLETHDEKYLVLEKRARTLKSQPGDICLPGGSIDPGETPIEAAIRETMEELGLKEEEIEMIGPMDYFISPYGQTMYPFVARTKVENFKPNPPEVEKVILIPMSYFKNHVPLIYEIDLTAKMGDDFPYHLIENGKDYPFRRARGNQYFYKYEDIVVWGFTAQIVKSFIDILKEEKNEKL